MRQRRRQCDAQGRVVATIEDYAAARWLLEEIFTGTVFDGVTPAVRQTVEAVARMRQSNGGLPAQEKDLVKALGLSKSTVNYRVRQAVKGGWLVNETTQKGAPAQLSPGAPLPDGCPLPTLDALLLCVDHPETIRTVRTGPPPAAAPGSAPALEKAPERLDTGSNGGSNPDPAASNRQPDGATAASEAPGPGGPLPWDSFLDNTDSDGADADATR